MKVLITGGNGFVAKNLKYFLNERSDVEIYTLQKKNNISDLNNFVSKVDFIFHLAGVNRPKELEEFTLGNETLTQKLCEAVKKSNRKIPIIYSSTIQVESNNPYGISKNNAEKILHKFNKDFKIPIYIFRLPNIFGKWSKPNYNSVVSTFCYNIIRDIPIQIKSSNDIVKLVYIDDVIKNFIKVMDDPKKINESINYSSVNPVYEITVGNLAKQLHAFKEIRSSKILERVGTGLVRALYSTYVSYMPKQHFSYPVEAYHDTRGSFVEILKTPDCGQFSYFTVLPNSVRGGHYHHSKTEKFLITKGSACFKFFNLVTSEVYEIIVNSDKPEIVESIPGWVHSIKNIGSEEMIVMLWSNEIFDQLNPDTFSYKHEKKN